MSKIGHIIERVKRFLGEHIDEFKRGDVIVEIGYTLKYVVLYEYAGASRSVYALKPISNRGSFNWLGHAEANHEKFWVEGCAVKVGKWDFKRKVEVDDEED